VTKRKIKIVSDEENLIKIVSRRHNVKKNDYRQLSNRREMIKEGNLEHQKGRKKHGKQIYG
jgi:hypothetical protein